MFGFTLRSFKNVLGLGRPVRSITRQRGAINQVRLRLESLEDRTTPSVIVNPSADPGSTTSGAYNLNSISSVSRYVITQSAGASDKADVYKLRLPVDEPLNLSLTGLSQNLNLGLWSSTGTLIGSSSAGGTTAESLTWMLSRGTYFVGVISATPFATNYTLTISAGTNWKMISGFNNQIHHVGIIRADGSQTIVAGSESWLIVHGRNSRPSDFTSLANAVASSASGSGVSLSRILLLDWETATAKAFGDFSNPWIIKAGDAVAAILTKYSITGSLLNEIGHSWGALLGYEIGRALGGGNSVNRLVALDPASQAFGYDDGRVNFGAVSTWSWSFISSGIAGGLNKASTADESFTVRKSGSTSGIGHNEVVGFLVNLIARTDSGANPFKLSQIKNRTLAWKLNQYNESGSRSSSGVFEVTMYATEQGGTWKLSSYKYVRA